MHSAVKQVGYLQLESRGASLPLSEREYTDQDRRKTAVEVAEHAFLMSQAVMQHAMLHHLRQAGHANSVGRESRTFEQPVLIRNVSQLAFRDARSAQRLFQLEEGQPDQLLAHTTQAGFWGRKEQLLLPVKRN